VEVPIRLFNVVLLIVKQDIKKRVFGGHRLSTSITLAYPRTKHTSLSLSFLKEKLSQKRTPEQDSERVSPESNEFVRTLAETNVFRL